MQERGLEVSKPGFNVMPCWDIQYRPWSNPELGRHRCIQCIQARESSDHESSSNPHFVQFKPSKELAFKPLAASLADPGEFLLTDFAKVSRGVDPLPFRIEAEAGHVWEGMGEGGLLVSTKVA